MIKDILLSPPIVFFLLLCSGGVLYFLMGRLRFRKASPAGQVKPYACGEEQADPIQADYGQFFPFAIFFTILHVVALMIASVPVETAGSYFFAVLYVLGAVIGLAVLYRS